MKTKNYTLLLAILAFTSLSLVAQKKSKREMIREEKMAFINDYCKFTEEEVKKFWPLHDEMQEKLKEVRKNMKRSLKDIKDKGVDSFSETELKQAMDNRKSFEQKLLDIK